MEEFESHGWGLVVYDTVAGVIEACFGLEDEGLGGECRVGGVGVDGTRYDAPISAMVESISQTGVWGFVGFENDIHAWIDLEVCSDDLLLQFLGHEIGHQIEIPLSDDEGISEEHRADSYGFAAMIAYGFFKQLKH